MVAFPPMPGAAELSPRCTRQLRRVAVASALALATIFAGPLAFGVLASHVEAGIAAVVELAPQNLPRQWQWNPPTHSFEGMVRSRR